MNTSSAIRYSDLLAYEAPKETDTLPRTVAYFSVLSVILSISPWFAHVLELKAKMAMSREHYLIVQQMYRGWGVMNTFTLCALVLTLTFAIVSRKIKGRFVLAMMSFTCLLITQIVFWMITYPIDQVTAHWTQPQGDWLLLRLYWEYSHAVNAGIGFVSLLFILGAVLWVERNQDELLLYESRI